jgi:hypothetical protein
MPILFSCLHYVQKIATCQVNLLTGPYEDSAALLFVSEHVVYDFFYDLCRLLRIFAASWIMVSDKIFSLGFSVWSGDKIIWIMEFNWHKNDLPVKLSI